MLVLGIDPGLQRTGWGIINKQGTALRYIASGLIQPNAKAPLPERLAALHDGIQQVTSQFGPDCAAIEETFVSVNGASTLKLGQARGAILLSLAISTLPVSEYAATLVKKTIVGVGRAEKQQVGLMVRHLLPGCDVTQADEADALAIAICHAGHTNLHHHITALA